MMKPDKEKFQGDYVDADFFGKWNKLIAINDTSTAKSRTRYIIPNENCPIAFYSKLQTQISLSTTNAKCIVLSMAMKNIKQAGRAKNQ